MEMRLSLMFVDVNLIGAYQRLSKIAPAYGDSILVFHLFFRVVFILFAFLINTIYTTSLILLLRVSCRIFGFGRGEKYFGASTEHEDVGDRGILPTQAPHTILSILPPFLSLTDLMKD